MTYRMYMLVISLSCQDLVKRVGFFYVFALRHRHFKFILQISDTYDENGNFVLWYSKVCQFLQMRFVKATGQRNSAQPNISQGIEQVHGIHAPIYICLMNLMRQKSLEISSDKYST